MKPWLWLPPKIAHDLAPWAMPMVSEVFSVETPIYQEKNWRGLQFKNPMGIAGGVDKSGATAFHWQKLGAGFLEVGTVTPEPQKSNPGSIMSRDIPYKALWNKMGFPNSGAKALAKKLKILKPKIKIPLFINIGKNRTTDNDNAFEDYCTCMETLAPYADAFVINISSPNTQDLRSLQSKDYLAAFLNSILDFKMRKNITQPLLIKLSPDMKVEDLHQTLDVTLDLKLDGWILTNTTTDRHPAIPFPKEGGMSGAPLGTLAKSNLQSTMKYLSERKKDQLLISVGGIMNGTHIKERMDMGADLVQIYSALIFEGPLFFQHAAKVLQAKD